MGSDFTVLNLDTTPGTFSMQVSSLRWAFLTCRKDMTDTTANAPMMTNGATLPTTRMQPL